MTKGHRSLLARLRRAEDGVAAIELALFAPLLCLILLGGFDVARFVNIRSGVDKVGFSVADVTAQYKELSSAAMTQVFKITGSSLTGYVSGTNGVTILTSVYLDNKKPKVKWQCYSASGNKWISKIGAEGAAAAVDASLITDPNDTLMVSEIFYEFKPVFGTFFTAGFPIYSASVYRPRLGTLTTKPC